MAGLAGKEDLLTRALPGGWKQRLALACAVLHRPRVVFLDEPTGGVDPISRRRFWALIDEMAGEGVTVIVTTHYLDEAEHCDRIALMHAGRLVALGAVAELKQVFAGRAVLEVVCPRSSRRWTRSEREPWVLRGLGLRHRLHVVVADAAERHAGAIEALLARDGNVPAHGRADRAVAGGRVHPLTSRRRRRGAAAAASLVKKTWAVARKELRQIRARSAEPDHAPRACPRSCCCSTVTP